MSRYLILFLLNIPIVMAGLLGVVVDFKLKKISRRSFVMQVAGWILITIGLASAYSIYQFLFTQHLTQTEPLSLFDVIQITAIILLLHIANRLRIKLETLENRVHAMHQALSIRLAEQDNAPHQSHVGS